MKYKWFQYISLGVLLCLVAILYFFIIDYHQAVWIQARFGYYFCLVLSLFVLYYGCRVLRSSAKDIDIRGLLRRHSLGLILCVLIAAAFQLHDPNRFLVFNDEPSHQAFARSMHEFREVSASKNNYLLAGRMIGPEQMVIARL